jgi:acyl-CoA thioesterase FadM
MNLWLRLFWLFLTARRRGPLALPDEISRLNFRVWPHDLDLAAHMNNGRYLTMMDLGRLDVLIRSGLWRALVKNKWTPIASAVFIHYRRELRPFQKFHLETRLATWDTTLVVMEQTFVIAGGPRDGQVAARALFKGGLYDRKVRAFVPIARLMETVGVYAESPAPSEDIAAFLRAGEMAKQGARG